MINFHALDYLDSVSICIASSFACSVSFSPATFLPSPGINCPCCQLLSRSLLSACLPRQNSSVIVVSSLYKYIYIIVPPVMRACLPPPLSHALLHTHTCIPGLWLIGRHPCFLLSFCLSHSDPSAPLAGSHSFLASSTSLGLLSFVVASIAEIVFVLYVW
ncbi:hypothetical protein B0T19DRAFT_240552 [Cercophora scortea]|uniref:Uncharacterized protein n=1 Tax=Cercophora scortea TaxID=314031 RepID=A0AAE0I8I2_9PEZI|nr:hypothetical protein B0T19DRAFT_240552 [Cercophora scortea]